MQKLLLFLMLFPTCLFSQTFAPPVTVISGGFIDIFSTIKSADLDNDGVLDLLMSTATINSFWIKGSGNSEFGEAKSIFNDELFGKAALALDADNDGDLDVITATSSDNFVLYSENLGDGEFDEAIIIVDAQLAIETMILLDVDNDENEDVLVSIHEPLDEIGRYFYFAIMEMEVLVVKKKLFQVFKIREQYLSGISIAMETKIY